MTGRRVRVTTPYLRLANNRTIPTSPEFLSGKSVFDLHFDFVCEIFTRGCVFLLEVSNLLVLCL